MRLQTRMAHDLMEQYVEWHKLPTGPMLSYPSSAPYVRLIKTSGQDMPMLAPWFTEEWASIANRLLSNLKRDRELEYKMLMHYYFGGQRQDLTGERFRCHRNKVREIVGSALDHLDGQISVIAA
jgi:hypothetical protein